MLDKLADSSILEQGLFVMLVGILGVFAVLVVFFLLMKLLEKMFPHEGGFFGRTSGKKKNAG